MRDESAPASVAPEPPEPAAGADDVNNRLVNGLFQVGMTLQSAMPLAEGELRDRLDSAISGVDQVIREIRQAVVEGLAGRADNYPSRRAGAYMLESERSELRRRARGAWEESRRLVGRAQELGLESPLLVRRSISARHARRGPTPAGRVDQVLLEAELISPSTPAGRGIGLVAAHRPVTVTGLHEILQLRMSRVYAAGDGATAVGLAMAHQPDVAILDDDLLLLDGLAAGRVIRLYAPLTRLLLVTSREETAERARAEGFAVESADAPAEVLSRAVERLAG